MCSVFIYYFFAFVLFLRQAEGEAAVREAFPEATIVRPAKLFGNDDRLLTWMASLGMKVSRVPMVNMNYLDSALV